jgi:hypothetical protein
MFASIPSKEPSHNPIGVHANRSMTLAKPPNSRRGAKREVQARQKTWLAEVLERTKLKPSQLAVGAGVSSSTLTRLLNSDDYSGTLAPETIERIKDTYRVPGPEELAGGGKSVLIGLSEAARFDPKREPADLSTIITAVINGRSDTEAWRLKTMALEGVGYLPGDIVFVRILANGESPRSQDAVCAKIIDHQHGSEETVWRIFDPPFLVGAANERTAYKPVLVDGERVRIFGVVEQSFRPHRLSFDR